MTARRPQASAPLPSRPQCDRRSAARDADITLVVKTYERPVCLFRLLRSIDRWAVGHRVVIADDSRRPSRTAVMRRFRRLDIDYLCLPRNVGASAGRNRALDRVATPYFLLCDDDFVLDERSDTSAMLALLRAHELDILGGVLYYRSASWMGSCETILVRAMRGREARSLDLLRPKGVPQYWDGRFRFEGRTLICDPVVYTPPVVQVDFAHNFFLARTEAVREVLRGWDEDLKTEEHLDFFLRAYRAGLRVGTTHEHGVQHRRLQTPLYRAGRLAPGFIYRFMAKHGLDTVVEVPTPQRRAFVLADWSGAAASGGCGDGDLAGAAGGGRSPSADA